MSTIPRTSGRASRFRWTATQFQKAADEGWFQDRKIELLAGEVYYMVRNPPHRNCVWKLYEMLCALVDRTMWTLTREDDVEMGDHWVPSPGIAILRGSFDLLKHDLLKGTDVALVVEVSYRTYSRDRNLKLTRYAENRIPAYWIVNVERRTVELYANPVGLGDLATYAAPPVLYREGDTVPVELDGTVIGHLDVREIFT